MTREFIILATPGVRKLFSSDLTLFERTMAFLDGFTSKDLPPFALRDQPYTMTAVQKPLVSVVYLAGGDGPLSGIQYLMLSTNKEGLGPTVMDIDCGARGLFPTVAQIRAGVWEPLERINVV